jgi:hypothetical protein
MVAMWVVSAVFSAMPVPTDKSGQFYVWLYNFGQIVSASLKQIRTKPFPLEGINAGQPPRVNV